MGLVGLIICLYCMGCSTKNTTDFESVLMVELNNQNLINVIKDYMRENVIDPNSTIITLTVFTVGEREVIYVSHAKQLLYNVTGYPTYLSSIEGQLIFVYSNIDRYLKRDLSKYIEEFGIRLNEYDPDSFVPSYHSETWKLTKCNSDTFIIEKRGGGELFEDYVPCGYRLDIDNLKLDTMLVRSINMDSLIRANLKLYAPSRQNK